MNKQEKFNEAAHRGDIYVMELLLSDIDINGCNEEDGNLYSAIYNAVYGGQPEAVKFLINNGAILEKNLLSICLDDFCDQYKLIAEILLENGYKITNKDIKEYLMTTDYEITLFFQHKFPNILKDIRNRGALI